MGRNRGFKKKKKKCFRWVFDNLRPNTYKNVEGDFPMSHS